VDFHIKIDHSICHLGNDFDQQLKDILDIKAVTLLPLCMEEQSVFFYRKSKRKRKTSLAEKTCSRHCLSFSLLHPHGSGSGSHYDRIIMTIQIEKIIFFLSCSDEKIIFITTEPTTVLLSIHLHK
jgi:hypothetical protein